MARFRLLKTNNRARADITAEWKSVIESLADFLRKEFRSSFPFEDDGDVSPEVLALRDAFDSFPVRTDVLLIDIAGSSSPLSEGRFWTLIRHDLSKPKTDEVTFHGTCKLGDIDAHSSLLAENFGLQGQDTLESIKSLTLRGQSDPDAAQIVELTPFDIREKLACYARELSEHLLTYESEWFAGRFKKQVDFNALYNLVPESPLSVESFLSIHPTTACFGSSSDGKPRTLEQWHDLIRSILLIPKVPESVQRTFRLAKQLYLFSYFEYYFFTVSQHYAYLALEAAVHARWSATLPNPVTVRCRQDEVQMRGPTHKSIFGLCTRNRWDMRKTHVKGKPFPFSNRAVLNCLAADRIITNWQREQIEWGLRQRNRLSHLEFAPIHIPSARTLAFVAELVNTMFHSLAQTN